MSSGGTLKFRARKGGTGTWYLYVRRAGQKDDLIPCDVPTINRWEHRAAAEAWAAPYQALLRRGVSREAATTALTTVTCDSWYEKVNQAAREQGQTSARDAAYRWNKWIAPRIGSKAPEEVTRDDIEDIRDALDAAIDAWKRFGKGEGRLAGKTAMNVWSVLTSAFDTATNGKRRELRVLDGKPNPCVGVKPPGDRESRRSRRKTFVYPREFQALMACEAIPLEWRELYAIAAMLYLRPGELRVLTFGDVDLVAGLVRITKAWDYQDGKVKTPKTANGVRDVPIEPALVPLLKRIAQGKPSDALVAPLLSTENEDGLAARVREHLKMAGVTRTPLHVGTSTTMAAGFRSWRDSGITWLALTGLGVEKIMRRAGHDAISTTLGYVKAAEDLTGDFGVPFGPLPGLVNRTVNSERETEPTTQNRSLQAVRRKGLEDFWKWAARVDSERTRA